LIGCDILASRSPWLHEREADALGVRLVYTIFDFAARGWDAAHLPKLLDAAMLAGFSGLNMTHPYKQSVMPHLDELADRAREIGAVNTVVFSEGRKIGYNTDVSGFAESMRYGLPDAELGKVVQIGAGGAGSATAYALLEMGVEHLSIFDKDAARLVTLVKKLASRFGSERVKAGSDLPAMLDAADGVINATPLGMLNYPGSAVPIDLLHQRHWVADIVYFPLETELLRAARLRGCRTLDGSGMVVHQAAEAFEIFTDLVADRPRMLRSFVEYMGTASAGGSKVMANSAA
jgi:shikimate dehydrogenase